jgi:predicted TIM-barrel fold metal-dependent hydrolase
MENTDMKQQRASRRMTDSETSDLSPSTTSEVGGSLNPSLPRRGLLGVMAGMPFLLGASAAGPSTRSRRIDVHYHPMVPDWVDTVAATLPPSFLARARAWTPEGAISEMDANGIDVAVCSISSPGTWFGDVTRGRSLTRACNEYMAGMVRKHPSRFGMFAALALRDVEGSLSEIAYAFDVLKADGIGIATSYDDKWIADPLFAPVFEELNRRKAVVYVHPTAANCCRKVMPGIPAVLLEYPVDTSRSILQWILTKSSQLYPNVKMIFSHSGGLFMSGVGRMQVLSDTQPEFGLPKDLSAEVAKLFYEISSSADVPTFELLRSYAPPTHILLGTDSPIGNDMAANVAQFERLKLKDVERRAIERDNAVRLLPRLGTGR